MLKSTVIVIARFAFAGWLLLIAFIAIGSALSHPGQFVLLAFVIAGVPTWVVIHRGRWMILVCALIAGLVTAFPVLLLVDYGADEGGVSGIEPTFTIAATLYVIALVLSALGMLIGRIVWLPWHKPEHQAIVR